MKIEESRHLLLSQVRSSIKKSDIIPPSKARNVLQVIRKNKAYDIEKNLTSKFISVNDLLFN